MAGEITQGRRVASLDDLERPGDWTPLFVLDRGDSRVAALWFVLPVGIQGRIAGQGHGHAGEPEWSIELHDDETVTVSPSIDYRPSLFTDGTQTVGWHGWLERGVWRSC